jgi:hypothetical protein
MESAPRRSLEEELYSRVPELAITWQSKILEFCFVNLSMIELQHELEFLSQEIIDLLINENIRLERCAEISNRLISLHIVQAEIPGTILKIFATGILEGLQEEEIKKYYFRLIDILARIIESYSALMRDKILQEQESIRRAQVIEIELTREELKQAYRYVSQRVTERTDELIQANQKLMMGIARYEVTEKQLEKRIDELRTINRIIAIVNQEMDEEKIIKLIVEEITNIEEIKAVACLIKNEEHKTLKTFAQIGFDERTVQTLDRIQMSGGVSKQVMLTKEPIIFHTKEDFSEDFQSFMQKKNLHSGLIIPLEGRMEVIGTLNLAAIERHYFNDKRLSLFLNIGRQIATGIEKARLYRYSLDMTG